jgi:hypothetical protein
MSDDIKWLLKFWSTGKPSGITHVGFRAMCRNALDRINELESKVAQYEMRDTEQVDTLRRQSCG